MVATKRMPQRATKLSTICAVAIMATALISKGELVTAFSPSNTPITPLTTSFTKGYTKNDNLSMNERTNRVSNLALSAAPTAISPSNLAVSLDRPLLSPVEYTYRAPASKSVWSSFLTVLLSDVFKTALVAFLLAVGVSLVPKFLGGSTVSVGSGTAGGSSSSGEVSGGGSVKNWLSTLTNRISTSIQSILPTKSTTKTKEAYTESMPFTGDGGWGKATLLSKKHIGNSYTIYEFALPKSYYKVPLALGQTLEFCCLSSNDDICTGSFYLYDGDTYGGKGGSVGVVRVVLPNDKVADEGNAQFVSSYLCFYLIVSRFVCVGILTLYLF